MPARARRTAEQVILQRHRPELATAMHVTVSLVPAHRSCAVGPQAVKGSATGQQGKRAKFGQAHLTSPGGGVVPILRGRGHTESAILTAGAAGWASVRRRRPGRRGSVGKQSDFSKPLNDGLDADARIQRAKARRKCSIARAATLVRSVEPSGSASQARTSSAPIAFASWRGAGRACRRRRPAPRPVAGRRAGRRRRRSARAKRLRRLPPDQVGGVAFVAGGQRHVMAQDMGGERSASGHSRCRSARP
ncbi:unnamed protein product [Acanthosepion pharaonis]|uniref:Uncharacterized protein n=1 Tax=Acanthosepion pharaonis TaxID=158019 RepID=A0A812DDI6_ACAPH|nr:unnamed protein product [Sepia pharaonis]